jgi:hypothetical protein
MLRSPLVAIALLVCSCSDDTSSSSPTEAANESDLTTTKLLPPVTMLTAGGDHACAVVGSQQVFCWGSNTFGESGLELASGRAKGAAPVADFPGQVLHLGAGPNGTCAHVRANALRANSQLTRRDDGSDVEVDETHADSHLYCWGTTQAPVTSTSLPGASVERGTPERVLDAEGLDETTGMPARLHPVVSTMTVGGNNDEVAYATSRGRVRRYPNIRGSEEPAILQNANIEHIAYGARHACAASSAAMWCWGENDVGQLGSSQPNKTTEPILVRGLSGTIVAIGAGGDFSCAATTAGVYCFGRNTFSTLGDGTMEARPTPTRVKGLPEGTPTALAVAHQHACAIVVGDVYCWGGQQLQRGRPARRRGNGRDSDEGCRNFERTLHRRGHISQLRGDGERRSLLGTERQGPARRLSLRRSSHADSDGRSDRRLVLLALVPRMDERELQRQVLRTQIVHDLVHVVLCRHRQIGAARLVASRAEAAFDHDV